MDFHHLKFDCRNDSPETVASAFELADVIALDNAFDLAGLREIRDVCARYFETLQNKQERTGSESMVLQKGAVDSLAIGSLLFPAKDYFQKLICYFTREQPILPYLQAILGTHRPGLLQGVIGVRRKDPNSDTSLLPFHQDGYAGGPSDAENLTLTVFTPFCEVGGDRPSMDVIAKKTENILKIDPTKGKRDYQYLHLDESGLDADQLRHLWAPKINEGGVIIISGKTPHRSQHSALNTKPRLSMDLRFVNALEPAERYYNQWIFDPIAGDFAKLIEKGRHFLGYKWRPD